ncbi:MAG: type II secretion system protein [Pirellulales bacterium]|nr:type II secretion system protein [Pirellulales bacterium]
MRYPTRFSETFKARRTGVRRALTLLELTFVVAVLGLFATMAVTRFGHDAIANTGARGFARKLALDMLQAQRRAISTGDNHYVQFVSSDGAIESSTLFRCGASGDTAVDSERTVPKHVTVTTSHMRCEYAFEGSALADYFVTVSGPDRSWQIQVTPATGNVRVTELP